MLLLQGPLFSFTAHEFKKKIGNDQTFLNGYFVNNVDRSIIPIAIGREREPMVKECWTKKFFQQKLNYTHFNPCQPHWGLADKPEDYKYSSAKFYETGIKDFDFLTHFNDC